MHFLKSPLNYIGGKYRILSQILPLFPSRIDTFVDLFCGGCSVGINIHQAQKIICNDNLKFLIDFYQFLQAHNAELILQEIHHTIAKYHLSLQNVQGYNALRKDYNTNKSPLLLFVLIAFSFNHQIRFNNAHEFYHPFGKNRSHFNPTMKGKENHILKQWLDKHCFKVHFVCTHYTNANYQTKHKDKTQTQEVLITNYNPLKESKN